MAVRKASFFSALQDRCGRHLGFRHRACPSDSFREDNGMFAISALLIGVIGIFYVRRRSARKKTAPAR
jgi:hypothetical protein